MLLHLRAEQTNARNESRAIRGPDKPKSHSLAPVNCCLHNRIERFRVSGSLAAVGAVFLVISLVEPSFAAQTRSQRCNTLQDQLSDQLKAHAGSHGSSAAAVMGAKAKKLCASGKQAQGLRTYAKALQLLGVQPIDPK